MTCRWSPNPGLGYVKSSCCGGVPAIHHICLHLLAGDADCTLYPCTANIQGKYCPQQPSLSPPLCALKYTQGNTAKFPLIQDHISNENAISGLVNLSMTETYEEDI